MKHLVKILITIVVSLLLFLPIAEITIRLYTSFFTFYDIEMSRYANELKIRSENPKIGHVHKPGSSAHLMDVDVQINSDGFRDREYPIERTDAQRIIFLGDSLTFAWGVAQDASFEVLLEEALGERNGPVEVINFGIGNYNTEQQVNLFFEKGLRYQPDKVVIFYFINDAEPTPVRSNWGFLSHSRVITFFWSRVNAMLTNVRAAQSYETFYSDLYRDDQPGWINTRKAFLEIRDVTRERGIELQVVLLPELHDLVDYPLGAQYAVVLEFLRQNDIEALDLAPFFRDETDPHRLWVALDDAHPNAYAHARIAEYSLDFIAGEENGRIVE